MELLLPSTEPGQNCMLSGKGGGDMPEVRKVLASSQLQLDASFYIQPKLPEEQTASDFTFDADMPMSYMLQDLHVSLRPSPSLGRARQLKAKRLRRTPPEKDTTSNGEKGGRKSSARSSDSSRAGQTIVASDLPGLPSPHVRGLSAGGQLKGFSYSPAQNQSTESIHASWEGLVAQTSSFGETPKKILESYSHPSFNSVSQRRSAISPMSSDLEALMPAPAITITGSGKLNEVWQPTDNSSKACDEISAGRAKHEECTSMKTTTFSHESYSLATSSLQQQPEEMFVAKVTGAVVEDWLDDKFLCEILPSSRQSRTRGKIPDRGGSSYDQKQQSEPGQSGQLLSNDANDRGCNVDEENDSGDGRRRPQKRPRKAVPALALGKTRLLRCPFNAFDPQRYSEKNDSEKGYRGCSSCYLTTIPRLKQHLYRVHQKPQHYCGRCFEIFANKQLLEDHARQTSLCPVKISSFSDRMTANQLAAIKIRDCGKSNEDKWYLIFQVLFPDAARPNSPYIVDSVSGGTGGFLEFFRHRGPSMIAARLHQAGLPIPYIHTVITHQVLEHALRDAINAFSTTRATGELVRLEEDEEGLGAEIESLQQGGVPVKSSPIIDQKMVFTRHLAEGNRTGPTYSGHQPIGQPTRSNIRKGVDATTPHMSMEEQSLPLPSHSFRPSDTYDHPRTLNPNRSLLGLSQQQSGPYQPTTNYLQCTPMRQGTNPKPCQNNGSPLLLDPYHQHVGFAQFPLDEESQGWENMHFPMWNAESGMHSGSRS